MEELKFEKALERLEKIVEELESGNIPLDEALKKYEEGVKLCRVCTQKLTQAETKIETLTKALSGAGEYSEEESAGTKKTGKKTKKAVSEDSDSEDEFLL